MNIIIPTTFFYRRTISAIRALSLFLIELAPFYILILLVMAKQGEQWPWMIEGGLMIMGKFLFLLIAIGLHIAWMMPAYPRIMYLILVTLPMTGVSHLLMKFGILKRMYYYYLPMCLKHAPESDRKQGKYILSALNGINNMEHEGFAAQQRLIDQIIKSIPCSLKDNPKFISRIVRIDGAYLEIASERLKNDKSIVINAVSRWGWALRFASETLRNDPDVVRWALFNTKGCSKYIGRELRENSAFVS